MRAAELEGLPPPTPSTTASAAALVDAMSRVEVDRCPVMSGLLSTSVDTLAVRGASYGFPGWDTVTETPGGTSKRDYLHPPGRNQPVMSELNLVYESIGLRADDGLSMAVFTAEPGSASQHALDLLSAGPRRRPQRTARS